MQKKKILKKIHQKIEGEIAEKNLFVRENYAKNRRVNDKFILRG